MKNQPTVALNIRVRVPVAKAVDQVRKALDMTLPQWLATDPRIVDVIPQMETPTPERP